MFINQNWARKCVVWLVKSHTNVKIVARAESVTQYNESKFNSRWESNNFFYSVVYIHSVVCGTVVAILVKGLYLVQRNYNRWRSLSPSCWCDHFFLQKKLRRRQLHLLSFPWLVDTLASVENLNIDVIVCLQTHNKFTLLERVLDRLTDRHNILFI